MPPQQGGFYFHPQKGAHMGWFIEAIANVCLELLGDLMAWTTNLITGLSLDIGMETTVVDGRYIPKVPDPGTLINPVGIKGYLLEETFPQAAGFTPLFMALGMSIIAFLFLAKMAIAFGGPFVKTESGGMIVARTGLAIIGTSYSYTIFVMFEALFNGIYSRFMSKYAAITTGSDSYALSISGSDETRQEEAVRQYTSGTNNTSDAFNMFGKDLIEDYQWGQGLALSVIAIALFAILLISFLKLVLEIYERYVIIGIMFYTAPLAFSTLVSKENNIFTNWVQMILSEFVVMCSNLFFTGVFIAAWTSKLTGQDHALFKDPRDFITYMFLMISWLIIGQQFDQHLKGLGLSTAQTGRGLGGAVAAGLGTAAVTMRAAAGALTGAGKLAGDVATGNTKWQKAAGSQGGIVGDFFNAGNSYAGLSKNDADRMLADIQKGNSAGFNRLDDNRKGEALTNLASASLGKGFDKAIADQTGRTPSSIDHSTVSMGADGMINGSTYEGEHFRLQSPGGVSSGYSRSLGNGWGAPISNDHAKQLSSAYAASQKPLNDQYAWKINENNLTEIVALDGQNNVMGTMRVPDLVAGNDIRRTTS